ncbi:DUF2207 domain-containing protein [Serpentinicella alkaliphila]|uniref:Putative membrane protein n=1 Tax=Serpentinicella alkaliphila TaxID=1734049 RepID=A0A4R2TIY5_9FIRM|nr:DUF2207 domain-containing protein [Serpentinicella alkaliphila]QUH26479.1 DUF2207 domain-containing protein [Serpentinicella alkaliphila]TCQ03241.1 putative membrane protein [Serpentinicella alkaliphila]
MSNSKKIFRLFSLIVFLFIYSSNIAYANRSLSIDKVYINVEILKDGTMVIQEERQITFNGQYNGFFQEVDKDKGVNIKDIRVLENGIPYEFNPTTTYGPPGTYLVRDQLNLVHIDWSIDALNETRTFVVEYIVENQPKIHKDIGELYYKFIGEWDDPQYNVTVLLTLPEDSNSNDLRAWGHGPLTGEVTILNNREILWQVDKLPSNAFLEGRVTFTPEIIDNAKLYTSIDALPEILEQEQRWANQANRERFISRVDIFLAMFVLLGTIIISFWLRRKYARPYLTTFDGEYYRELPADYSPAELGVLLRKGKPNTDDFTATIIHLALRGYIRLDEYSLEKKSLFSKKSESDFKITRLEKSDSLQTHEKKALDFIFEEISKDYNHVTFNDIENYAKNKPKRFLGFWQSWVDGLGYTGKTYNFFDDGTSKGTIIGVITGIFMFFIGIGSVIVLSTIFSGIALILTSFVVVLVAITLNRRSQKGEEDFVRWMAFKRFLLHFSEMNKHELPSLVIWEHYMVYAITLGVAKEVIKQLQILFPNLQEGNHHFGYGWYYYRGTSVGSFNSLTNSFSTLTTNLNNSINTAISKSSSGTGSGGGFSSGGGFGGGGGRGGGR